MGTEYKTYLAGELVSEQKTVSYRTLSRALKVHVNAAKCMLFDFYQEQNQRKPGSVYATYLLSGIKKDLPSDIPVTNGKHDADAPPQSSPPIPSSSMADPSQQASVPVEHERVSVRTITLVREEHFEDMKQTYEHISSMHLYSLSPTKLMDLVTLTDLSRGLYTDVFAMEDPMIHNKTYGVIQNPLVRRRTAKRPTVAAAAPPKFQPVKDEHAAKSAGTVKPAPKPSGIAASFNKSSSTLKKEDTASRPSSRDSTSTAGSKPTLKRDASDIFKAFAKGKTKTKANADSQEADTPMSGLGDDDEGESEDEALFLDTGNKQPAKKRASNVKKERADKAAKLRKMMDSDDEEADPPREALEATKEQPKSAETEEQDPDTVAWSDSDTEAKPTKPAPEEPAAHKRRRGKRKVMKKRTMKDADGYLVTKEEEAWESFSETDDDAPSKQKVKSAFSGFGGGKTSSQGGKPSQKAAASSGKKAAGAGKKDIMSFFGKK